MRPRRRPFFALALVLLSLGLGLLAAELVVRRLEQRADSVGLLRKRYEEAYQASAFKTDGLGPAGFFAPGFSGQVTDEFGRPVPWIHNSRGFRSRREYPPEPAPGVLRVLLLGDSFVAGHRLAQDDTVGARLERWLAEAGGFPGAEVLIAAIEHPTKGLEYLERFGLAQKPRVVVLGLTLGNDVAQLYFSLGEHGQYRFNPDGELEANPLYDHGLALAAVRAQLIPPRYLGKTPGSTPWNAHPEPPPQGRSRSHLLGFVGRWVEDRRERRRPQAILSIWGEYREPRLFDGNGLGLYLNPAPPEIERAYRELGQTLRAYRRLCERHHASLVVLVHAQRFQLQPLDWMATVEAYGLSPSAFDLSAPSRRIAEICAREGLTCLDPTTAMAERYSQEGRTFFMPRGDMHWNTLGSRTFFELIRDDLARFLRQSPPPPPRP